MLTQTRLPLLLLLCAATCVATHARTSSGLRLMLATAAAHTDATETDRNRDGLSGPVRRIRTETAKVLVKEGKIIEGPRVVLETATYDMKGAKIDNAYFLSAGGSLTGKEVYKYDDRGNIVEMTLFNADGSVMSKEVYQYEFDAIGNWTKMIASVAVVENGKLSFEPTEITYRAISYFLEETVARKLQPGTPSSAATVQPNSSNVSAQPQPVAVVKTARGHSARERTGHQAHGHDARARVTRRDAECQCERNVERADECRAEQDAHQHRSRQDGRRAAAARATRAGQTCLRRRAQRPRREHARARLS